MRRAREAGFLFDRPGKRHTIGYFRGIDLGEREQERGRSIAVVHRSPGRTLGPERRELFTNRRTLTDGNP